jgi:predicted phosphoadenosine phosphosulfate sulfurtransferase
MSGLCKWCQQKDCGPAFIARCKRKKQLDRYQEIFRREKDEYKNMDELLVVVRANKDKLPEEERK